MLAALDCMGVLMAVVLRHILHQHVALAEASGEAVVPMTSVWVDGRWLLDLKASTSAS